MTMFGFYKQVGICFLEEFTVVLVNVQSVLHFCILVFEEDRSIINIPRNLAEWWVEGSSSYFGGDLPLHGADGARARRHSLASGVAACSGCGHQCTVLFGHFHFGFLHCSTVDCLAVVGLVDDHFSAASYSVPSSGTVSLCNP